MWESEIRELAFYLGLEDVLDLKVEVLEPIEDMVITMGKIDYKKVEIGARRHVFARNYVSVYQKFKKLYAAILSNVKESDILRAITNRGCKPVDNREGVEAYWNVVEEFCQESGFQLFQYIKAVTHIRMNEDETFDSYHTRFESAREDLLRRRSPIDDDLLLCFFSTGLRSDKHRSKLNDIISDEKSKKWEYSKIVRKVRD